MKSYLGTTSFNSSGNGVTRLSLVFAHNCSALRRVFTMSIATVIGPTPPGTGVIQLATLAADS